jgi:ADP-L-glycero-D-manno-heptose 6-epimerase
MGDAASSVYQLFRQWQQESRMIIPLYENSETSDNEPLMDRIFIKDVVTVYTWFMNHLPASGFYYLGTGYPRPLSAVAKTFFSVLRQEEKIEFVSLSKEKNKIPYRMIDLPLNSLRRVGYKKNFTPLEKGIRIFMREFLKK